MGMYRQKGIWYGVPLTDVPYFVLNGYAMCHLSDLIDFAFNLRALLRTLYEQAIFV